MTEPRPIPFERFGSLRLDQSIDEVSPSEAILFQDMDWNDAQMGSLRQRGGAAAWSDEAAEETGRLIPHLGRTTRRFMAHVGNKKVIAYNVTGKAKEEVTYETTGLLGYSFFATPTADFTYICGDSGKKVLRYADATGTFSEPTATVDGVAGKAMPKPAFLIAWPEGDNRMIALSGASGKFGPGEAETTYSHAWLSDAGNAESWHTVAPEANYLQLSPGDGERFTGGCVWNGQAFIFKKTRMFVLYSVDEDSEGAPIFNYRTVELGTEIANESAKELVDNCCIPTREGVVFLSSDGIYITTGGTPVNLAGALDPLGRAGKVIGPAGEEGTGFANLNEFPFTVFYGLAYTPWEGRLYAFSEGLILVYDFDRRAWLTRSAKLKSMAVSNVSPTAPVLNSLYLSSGKRIYKVLARETADPTVTVKPVWQSGFYGLELPDEKTLDEAEVLGSGKGVTVSGLIDLETKVGFKDEVTFNGSRARLYEAQTGALFSHRIEITKEGSYVNRLVRYLRETETAGSESP